MRNNIDESVGFYIKKFRQEKKITQKQLGNLLGVSQGMIAQYEKGIRHPKVETLRKIASVLEVNLSDFLEVGQTLIDNLADDESDSITKLSNTELVRKVSNSVSVNKNSAPISKITHNDIFEKYNMLNTIGQAKAKEYISDLAEQDKYLKEPSTIE